MDTFDYLNKLENEECSSKTRNDISNNRMRYSSRNNASFTSATNDPLESMERELDLLSSMTGISFEKTESVTLEQDGNGIVKQHSQRGYCHQLPFKLKYKIRFSKLTDGSADPQTYKISDIHLKVGPQLATEELEPTLKRKNETLESVYKTLYNYTKKDRQRQEYFEKVLENFPGCVKKNSDNSIRVSHPSKQGISSIFTWNIIPDENAAFTHSVSLDVAQHSPEDLSPEAEEFLNKMPDILETLKTSIGQANALMAVVDLITGHMMQTVT